MKCKRIAALLTIACMLLPGCTQNKKTAYSTPTDIPVTDNLESVGSTVSELTNELSIGVVNGDGINYYIEALADQYMSVYNDVKVSVQYYQDSAALNMAIASGDGPDIVHIFDVPYTSYRSKGLFLDISDIITTDEIYPELVSAYTSEDGRIYSFPLSFAIGCLTVEEDVAQGRTGWTVDEFINSAGDSANIFAYDVYTLAETLMDMNLEQFINPDTGTAELDCALFYDMLDFLYAANQREESAENNNSNWFSCMDPTSFISVRRDGWDLIGWPTPDRTGYLVESRLEFAILTSSRNLERSRQFLSFFLTAEGQELCHDTAYDLPVRRDVCENLWTAALGLEKQAVDKNATEEAALEAANAEVEPVDFELFCDLLARISCVSRKDKEVQAILSDDLGAFLNGDKTKEEITSIIENRLNIYLSEQG